MVEAKLDPLLREGRDSWGRFYASQVSQVPEVWCAATNQCTLALKVHAQRYFGGTSGVVVFVFVFLIVVVPLGRRCVVAIRGEMYRHAESVVPESRSAATSVERSHSSCSSCAV